MIDDLERRVLGHLPVWRTPEGAAEALRLETTGHNDEEVAALLANVENGEDEREGTARDPTVIGSGDPRIIDGCGFTITSYTVGAMLARLRRDEHFGAARFAHEMANHGDVVAIVIQPLDESIVMAYLEGLEERGLAAESGGNWTMTEQGFEALTA
jgi:hypothetical protein